MKKNCMFFRALALIAAWAFVGCSDDKTEPAPTPPLPPEVQNFTLSVRDITTTSCTFTVEPADAHMSYIAMLIQKSEFDKFASPEECIEQDLADFEEEAKFKDVTLEQLLMEYLRYGRLEVEVENELTPGEEYYLYAYGLSEQGEPTTKLEKTAFRAEAIPQVEIAFDLQIKDLTLTSCTVAVTATPDNAPYFINVIDEATYQEFGASEQTFADYTNFVVKYNMDRYGATPEALFRAWSNTGTGSVERTNLKPGSKYYAYAIGINSQFQPNSAPCFVLFETEAASVSDNTFTAEFDEVGYTSLSGTIIPTNNDSYLWSIQAKEEIDEFYADDAEVMESLCGMYVGMGILGDYLTTGRKSFTINNLKPETDYYLLVFGWDQAPTTGLTKIPVRTAAATGDPKDLVLDIELSNVNHKGAYISITPSNGSPYYYDVIEAETYEAALAELGSVDAAVLKLVEESIAYAVDWYGYDPVEFMEYAHSLGSIDQEEWSNGEPETRYVVFGCAIDLQTAAPAAERGFVSEIFTTLPRIVSDAAVTFEMGKYFDSTALAESDPDKYGNLPKGYGVMNYTLVPNGSAAHWYSNFYPTNEYATLLDDDTLILFLVDYGYESGNPDNVSYDRSTGTYVLPWHQEYSFIAVAVDENGVYGEVTREVVLLSPEGASPADEFVPSFQSIMKAAAKSLAAKSPRRASRFFGKKL